MLYIEMIREQLRMRLFGWWRERMVTAQVLDEESFSWSLRHKEQAVDDSR